jgi:Predicted Zn-dependent protease (DUF2268)
MLQVDIKDSPRHAFTPTERALIRRICDRTESEVRELLPQLPASLRLTVTDGHRVIPEYGSMGWAIGSTQVHWTVDASRREGVLALAKSQLRATLFHELHHVVRGWVRAAPGARLLHGVVSEGLATAFERDAAGHRAPWGEYPPEVRAWVAELLALPDDAPYGEWMFRHSDGRRWVGYRAGTFIADLAMAQSRRSAADLVMTPTAEILALAFPLN